DLLLWKFETSQSAVNPYMVLNCHNGGVHDFVFLGSTSMVATAGLSTGSGNVCIWDTMMPESKRKAKSFSVNESGAYSLAFSMRHQLLISGGKKGDICKFEEEPGLLRLRNPLSAITETAVFDVRRRALVNTFQGHQLMVKTLTVDEDNDVLVSGSTDGDVKIWDLKLFHQADVWKNVHAKHHVLRKPGDGRGSPEAISQGAAYLHKAKQVVLQYGEWEAKVRYLTLENLDTKAWGASSTLMLEIAEGTNRGGSEAFNEIMDNIYKRFSEPRDKWRCIYKVRFQEHAALTPFQADKSAIIVQNHPTQALTLLEYLVKNGSERVVDNARDHIYAIKVLKEFQFVDDKAKDQGLNGDASLPCVLELCTDSCLTPSVRNRAKEIVDLLGDTERIKFERRKARENRNKYTAIGSDSARSGGGGGGGRYGGFGSDSYRSGGDSYSSGGGAGFRDEDRGDSGWRSASPTQSEPSKTPAPAPVTTQTPAPVVAPAAPAAPAVNLLDWDAAPAAPPQQAASSQGWAAFPPPQQTAQASVTDDFGGFQSAGSSAPQPAVAASGWADFGGFQGPSTPGPAAQPAGFQPPAPAPAFAAFSAPTPAPVQSFGGTAANPFSAFPNAQQAAQPSFGFAQPQQQQVPPFGAPLGMSAGGIQQGFGASRPMMQPQGSFGAFGGA
ncbi:Epsin-3, clathrin recruitment and traffic between the Golgi and endosome, partial [Gonapodya sp. JEL0774]